MSKYCYLYPVSLCMYVKSLSRIRLFATHGLEPIRLLSLWNFPGKSTGVGCHFLLHPVSFYILKFILIYLKVFSNFPVNHWFFRSEFLVVYICVNFPNFFLLLISDFNSLHSEQHTLYDFNHFKFTEAWFMD